MPALVIPEYITVHLGAPDEVAQNVTVSFPDYIKNVASSEIYPTWPESAIRANMYAQISFALNRIYTEYYRTRGYDFDITNNTQYDQAFVKGRDIFENISRIVDEIFNDYVEDELDEFFEDYEYLFNNDDFIVKKRTNTDIEDGVMYETTYYECFDE